MTGSSGNVQALTTAGAQLPAGSLIPHLKEAMMPSNCKRQRVLSSSSPKVPPTLSMPALSFRIGIWSLDVDSRWVASRSTPCLTSHFLAQARPGFSHLGTQDQPPPPNPALSSTKLELIPYKQYLNFRSLGPYVCGNDTLLNF